MRPRSGWRGSWSRALGSGPQELGKEVEVETRNGEVVQGRLAEAPSGRIGLLTPDFAEPLQIAVENVRSVTALKDSASPDSDAELFAFHLIDGDWVVAEIGDVTEETWVLVASGLGRVEVPRSSVAAVEAIMGGAVAYDGSSGIAGWSQLEEKYTFRAEKGSLLADEPRAGITRDVGLDEERELRLALSWPEDPRFRIAIGHERDREGEGVTLEAWGESLVAWREERKHLEVVELCRELERGGSIALSVRIAEESVGFFDEQGRPLGTLDRHERSGGYLTVLNDGEGIALERLRVLDGRGLAALKRLEADEVIGFDPSERALLTSEGPVPLRRRDRPGLEAGGSSSGAAR